jgi:hypothetical protein
MGYTRADLLCLLKGLGKAEADKRALNASAASESFVIDSAWFSMGLTLLVAHRGLQRL